MKLLVISDLHYEKKTFHGIDESQAWNWLLTIVDYHKPEVILSAGDWGTAVSWEDFENLLEKTVVLSIYGNHDNVSLLAELLNKRYRHRTPVLVEDGEIYEIAGLRIAGINGIISYKDRTGKHMHRRKPEDFLSAAEKLKGKKIDILLIHETPYLPSLFPFMSNTLGAKIALEVTRKIKPKLVINGHMHSGGYKTYTFPFGTNYIYICTDQKHRHYLILDTSNPSLQVWNDWTLVSEVKLW